MLWEKLLEKGETIVNQHFTLFGDIIGKGKNTDSQHFILFSM